MSTTQLNVRVSTEVEAAIDAKRVTLATGLGRIPSRSEIVRLALEAFLGVKIEPEGEDARTSKASSRNAPSASRRRKA